MWSEQTMCPFEAGEEQNTMTGQNLNFTWIISDLLAAYQMNLFVLNHLAMLID